MRTFPRLASTLTLSAFGCLCVVGCTPAPPTVTVGGQILSIMDQSYGGAATTVFCSSLDTRGQYEVVITDFIPPGLCSALKPNSTNSPSLFHGQPETNMLLIFPNAVDALKKIPAQTVFTVTSTHNCSDSSGGGSAAAFFHHQSAGSGAYDVAAEADSGTITVTYFAPGATATGTYDLNFGADHVVGSFNAVHCANIAPGVAK